MKARLNRPLVASGIAALFVLVFGLIDNTVAATRCIKPNLTEMRVIRLSFEHTLLPDLTGEPAAGPLFEPCVLRHPQHGRYVLLDFSAEGFYGGNNWGLFWALGQYDDTGRLTWFAGGPTAGNAPSPYHLDAVRSDDNTWIEWHAARCVTLGYRGLTVPPGANAAFPNARWPRVGIEHRRYGACGEGTSASCALAVTANGTPGGERIGR